jgi:peptidoglycan/LPS O-acetylase OafA/YrhL
MPGYVKPFEVGAGRRYFGLDLIRALAITLVLLSHTIPSRQTWENANWAKFLLGYFGVEMFFLLSGYLIGAILIKSLLGEHLNSLRDVMAFWKRRWFRTLPNYYLFLILMLLVACCAGEGFPKDAIKCLWFGQSFLSEGTMFFRVAWSLAIEEWFYILFPLVLLILAKLLSNGRRAALVCIVLFLVWPVLLRCFLRAGSWDMGIRSVTLARLDAITYGVLLAFVRDFRIQLWKGLTKCWPIGVVATAFLGGLLFHFMKRDGSANVLFFRVFYFCSTSVSLGLCFPKAVELRAPENWTTKVIHSLSLWSYSIYLSHTLLAGIFGGIIYGFGWAIFHYKAAVISCLVWMTTLPISALLYRFYEKPLMDLRDRP